MYLNKGDSLPNYLNHNFISPNQDDVQVIEVDLNDPYFQQNNLSSLEGQYTLGIEGLSKINKVHFFISTESDRYIVDVHNFEQKLNCRTNTKSSSCYFMIHSGNEITNDIFVNTEYIYGSGGIYAQYYEKPPIDIFQELTQISKSSNISKDEMTLNSLVIKSIYNFK